MPNPTSVGQVQPHWRVDPSHIPPVPSGNALDVGGGLATKHVVDLLSAFVLLVLTLPLVMLAAILIKITSRGPVFYSQTRLGRNGRPFTIWKLRSMKHRCESLTGAQWSKPGDSRVTWI